MLSNSKVLVHSVQINLFVQNSPESTQESAFIE